MVLKVCIKCDEIIKNKDEQVDYDVLAEFYKRDSNGDIYDQVPKPTTVYFHLKCFREFKKQDKKKHYRFAEGIGKRRLIIQESPLPTI